MLRHYSQSSGARLSVYLVNTRVRKSKGFCDPFQQMINWPFDRHLFVVKKHFFKNDEPAA